MVYLELIDRGGSAKASEHFQTPSVKVTELDPKYFQRLLRLYSKSM